jgi:hypothetical protein
MKKKVLMSLVLLALIGTHAVFAQEPTLDKLEPFNLNRYIRAANKSISGAVVIPATATVGGTTLPVREIVNNAFRDCTGMTSVIIPEGITVIGIGAFQNTGLTSVTIPASVTRLGREAFKDCDKLTSVTILCVLPSNVLDASIFPGDLRAKYVAGGVGTYTRPAGSNTWTKVGGFSLNGTWKRSDGMEITITENGQNITITGNKPNNEGRLNDTYAKR